MKPNLLIVDDEPGIVESLKQIFHHEAYLVHTAQSGEQALQILQKHPIDIVLTDLRMGKMDGLSLLRSIRIAPYACEVIVMTAYGTIENAVEAMKEGAYDFITKPFRKALVTRTVKRALEKRTLVAENQALKQALAQKETPQNLIGRAPCFLKALKTLEHVAQSDAVVLLQGESGTGKEVFAQHLHQYSNRHTRPLVVINCAALPESLIESELFGYEKGAFTGASQNKEGCFARAHRSTLFLDEIGEIPLHMQAKLLRALENGEIKPLGGNTTHVDVRIVAASKKNLEEEVKNGRFREDLFYRLNVVSIRLPALRERSEDIELLAHAFLQKYTAKSGKPHLLFSAHALHALKHYQYPGNIRELEHAIERAVILCTHQSIEPADLPDTIYGSHTTHLQSQTTLQFNYGMPLEDMEKQAIAFTLQKTQGNKELAAKILGISLRTIYRKLGEPEPT